MRHNITEGGSAVSYYGAALGILEFHTPVCKNLFHCIAGVTGDLQASNFEKARCETGTKKPGLREPGSGKYLFWNRL